MTQVQIPFPKINAILEFDCDTIAAWDQRNDVVETGVSEQGGITRELGEFTHLTLTFKLADMPQWLETVEAV